MATPKINIAKISDFPKVRTPEGSDRILIDREGKGGSITLSQIPVSDPVEKRISDEVEDLSNRIDNCGASAWSEITDKPFNTIDGNTLVNRSGALCVNTTDDAEQDNTRPITSSGVHVICGNINALLQAI